MPTGRNRSEKGDFQKSAERFTLAAKLQPGDANAKLGLAKALIELNQSDRALPLLEEAVKEEPTNSTARYRLATLYRKDGRLEDAKREIDLYKKLKDMKEKLRALYKGALSSAR